MTIGEGRALMNNQVKELPWENLKVITMSAPVVGGERFHDAFGSVHCHRVVLASEPITQAQRHYHVGQRFHIPANFFFGGGGKGMKFILNYHEPRHVRRSLIARLQEMEVEPMGTPHWYTVKRNDAPWTVYENLHDALDNSAYINESTLGAAFIGIDKAIPFYLERLANVARNGKS